MKSYVTPAEWEVVERVLARANIGYTVIFDNHHGEVEMLITPNVISVARLDVNEEE